MWKDYAKMHFIVFLWGFTAILGKLISIAALSVTFWRVAIASMAILLLLGWLKRYARLQLSRRATVQIMLAGVLVGTHWVLFFYAAKVASVSICLAGMSTASLFTAFLEPIIRKRPFRSYQFGFGLVVMVGVGLIANAEYDQLFGLGIALVSAFIGALFSTLNGRFADAHGPMAITFYEMLGATLAIGAFIPLFGSYLSEGGPLTFWPSPMDWGYLLLLSLVCTVYAFYVSVELLQRMSVFTTNLIINMEPVYGILLALLIFGEEEQMQPNFYVGAAIILLAVLAYPRIQRTLDAKYAAKSAQSAKSAPERISKAA